MTETKTVVAVHKVKPAQFTIEQNNWRWTWLPELAEVIGLIPEKVIMTFRDIVKEQYSGYGKWRIGELVWRDASGNAPKDEYSEPPTHGQIYVPAGFTEDVLYARELRVVRLERVFHSSLCAPRGSLRNFYAVDPQNPNKRELAIIGHTDLHYDSPVWAPIGKKYPLLG